ncbi:transcription factor bHLH30 [Lolium perenne]|uniref:transcription factor bHLH30 n=1 Tax=Lolium perenne TaxID=4522 RepID=UPI0021EA86D6|nr:transcription factor bHLH30-like [Lolium perenne]
MWEGGVHGSHHEAAARLLPPWFGGPAAFAEPVGAGGGGSFSLAGSGGYACDVVGQGGGMFGFGFEAAVAAAQQQHQQQQRAAEAAAAAGSSKAVVSGLLGSLQAELGRMNAAGEIMDAKALAASRSHSEAERRRRQRINGHLARLRSLLPNTTKTDKASLLAEVLEHVKELKRQTSAMAATAVEDEHAARPAQMLPTEADELCVDAAEDSEGRLVVRASLCCEDRPDLIPDIIRALSALRLHAHRAEITTLGGRVRSVLLITQDDREGEGGDEDAYDDECAASHRRHESIASVQEALRGVMDRRAACSNDTSSSGGGGGSIKRQRMNYGSAQEQCSV